MAKTSQRAKLVLKARENLLTKDIKNDYYLTVKSQRTPHPGRPRQGSGRHARPSESERSGNAHP